MLMGLWSRLVAHGRQFLIGSLGFLCLCGLLYGATLSSSNRQCQRDRATRYAKYDNPDFFEKSGTLFVCEGATIDANGELLTAIATIIMAIFTGTLWFVTNKSLNLALKESAVTHRPKMRVRFVSGPDAIDDQRFEFQAYLANIGDSTATVKSAIFWAIHTFDSTEHPIELTPLNMEIAPIEVGAGILMRGSAKDWNSLDDMFSGLITVVGRVVYEDAASVSRITSFARDKPSPSARYRVSEKYAEDEYED